MFVTVTSSVTILSGSASRSSAGPPIERPLGQMEQEVDDARVLGLPSSRWYSRASFAPIPGRSGRGKQRIEDRRPHGRLIAKLGRQNAAAPALE